ncbi:transposase [Acetobacter sacchari]|uniref:Transposase n=1 Tax=Acetobacter sacchari TaxID=2661687 RepID=A0ABS3LWH3_9PROT|nr:Mu transposase C-terminal domain-containing protein [Acetobacter sacchari]MBO1360252.1 transposase [Acetobacter sacchari]
MRADVDLMIEKLVDVHFRKKQRFSISAVMRDVRTSAQERGVRVPSRKAVVNRIMNRPARKVFALKKGSKAARHKYTPVSQGLRPERPLDIVQADHTKVDIIIVDESRRFYLGRPWLTLILDVCSRMVLGFHLSFDAPSAATVALAIAQAMLPKDDWLRQRGLTLPWPAYGIPGILHLDNAKEFRSRALRRGCEQHGIRLDYRPPARPHFGGHIERLMGTLMKRVHDLPGTTFSSVAERGDYDSEREAVLTLAEFEKVFALEVLGPYHNAVHRGLGQSPQSAWDAAHQDLVPEAAPERNIVYDFLPFEERTVQRDGIHLFNELYYDNILGTLIGQTGARFRVKYDPRDISEVYLELPSGDHARIPYADLTRPPVSLWELREIQRSLRSTGQATANPHVIAEALKERHRIVTQATSEARGVRRSQKRPRVFQEIAASEKSPDEAPEGHTDEAECVPAFDHDTAWKTEFPS